MCYSVHFCQCLKRDACVFPYQEIQSDIGICIGSGSVHPLSFSFFISLRLLVPLCRNLRQPAVGHRDVLRHRPPLRVALRLLEALLAAMAGQGGRRAEPDVGAAARDRRVGRGRGAVAFTPAAAEEGGPLLFLALPFAGAAGTPPLL